MAKKMKYSKEFIVGAIGILALLLIYLMINFFKGIDLFKDGERYYVKFDNIGQVVNSSPIYLNGYKAGNVQGINYDFANMKYVIVTIDIDKRLRIPKGSYAEVNNHMLGGSDVSIVLGNSNKYLAPGDTIEGRLNKGLQGEMGEVIPSVTNMVPKIDSILTSLNTLLATPELYSSIKNVEKLTNNLAVTTAQINSLLGKDIPQITERMIQMEDDVLAVSSQIKDVDYKQMFTSLESTLNNLEAITQALNNGEGTAGMLLKDNSLYNKLDSTCSAANALLTDLKQNPKRYVHFSVFGGKEK
ncbi:MAG: MCE family protein [Bacteroidaceae bacterium]|nr:MCE family protein [Bacteroidaceae bacterium]